MSPQLDLNEIGLNGVWKAGNVPSGAAQACQDSLTSGSIYAGETLTVYDTTGEFSGFGPIASLCDLYATAGLSG